MSSIMWGENTWRCGDCGEIEPGPMPPEQCGYCGDDQDSSSTQESDTAGTED